MLPVGVGQIEKLLGVLCLNQSQLNFVCDPQMKWRLHYIEYPFFSQFSPNHSKSAGRICLITSSPPRNHWNGRDLLSSDVAAQQLEQLH